MPLYMNYKGLDAEAVSRSAPSVGEVVVTQHTDDGGAINGFAWGLDRVDQDAPASFFESGFLGGVHVAGSAGDPDLLDDLIVGNDVRTHVKSIDIDATALDVNDTFVFRLPDSTSVGGSGDDILIGGTTSHDGMNFLLGNGSVGHVRSDAEPFSGYSSGALGGVWKAGENIDLDAIIAAGDHHDPHFGQGFGGGVSVAVADVELPMLMHAKFMF